MDGKPLLQQLHKCVDTLQPCAVATCYHQSYNIQVLQANLELTRGSNIFFYVLNVT